MSKLQFFLQHHRYQNEFHFSKIQIVVVYLLVDKEFLREFLHQSQVTLGKDKTLGYRSLN